MKLRIASLTSIRGIAAWWVVIYHFRELLHNNLWITQRLLDRGYLAVDLFFELSGFVMSLNYYDNFITFNYKNYTLFMNNRLLRIYPLHFVILVIFLINPIAVYYFSNSRSYPAGYSLIYFLESLILVQNWGFSSSLQWNIPAWSISAEWFAYFLFPFIIHCFTKYSGIRYISGFFSIIIITSIIVIGQISQVGLGGEIPKYGLIRCLFEFSLGIMLYFLYLENKDKIKTYSNFITILFLFIFFLLIWTNFADYYIAPTCFLLLLLSILENNSILSNTINNKLTLFLGEISYSTYMVHFLLRSWIKFILIGRYNNDFFVFCIYIIFTLALSVFFYYLVEIPGKKIMGYFTRKYLH